MASPHTNRSIAISLIAIAAGMLMLSFAAVPLYRIFCQITGFGGTTQIAKSIPTQVLEREFEITFNTDTDPNLPWKFKPLQRHITIKAGQTMLAAFEATNQSDQPSSGTATYNVTPFEAGAYFNKIQCFCFEKQTLAAGAVVNMPISFFIDPEIVNDPQLKGVKHLTLSYTFFSELSKNEYQ